jgi:hypothetical protein
VSLLHTHTHTHTHAHRPNTHTHKHTQTHTHTHTPTQHTHSHRRRHISRGATTRIDRNLCADSQQVGMESLQRIPRERRRYGKDVPVGYGCAFSHPEHHALRHQRHRLRPCRCSPRPHVRTHSHTHTHRHLITCTVMCVRATDAHVRRTGGVVARCTCNLVCSTKWASEWTLSPLHAATGVSRQMDKCANPQGRLRQGECASQPMQVPACCTPTSGAMLRHGM